MNITESYLIDIMRQEYNKRLSHFLNEKLDIKYLSNPEQLKVKDEEGNEYTIAGFIKKLGKIFIKLWLPDQARFDVEKFSQKRLLNTQGSENTLTSEEYTENLEDVYLDDEEEVVDLEASDSKDRKYKLVSKDDFLKNYSLS